MSVYAKCKVYVDVGWYNGILLELYRLAKLRKDFTFQKENSGISSL